MHSFYTKEIQNSKTQQYVNNIKASIGILVQRFFSSQEQLSYFKLVLKSPQIKALIEPTNVDTCWQMCMFCLFFNDANASM